MNNQEKIAKCIRVITVPPVLVILMLVILYERCPTIFHGVRDLWMALIWGV